MRRIPLVLSLLIAACSPTESVPDVIDAARRDAIDTAADVPSADTVSMDAMDSASPIDVADAFRIDAMEPTDAMDAMDATSVDAAEVVDVQTGDSGCGVCVLGTARCAAGTGYLERCENMNGCVAWAVFNACPSNPGEPQTCSVDGCLRCGSGDAGACPPTLCSVDVDCGNLGLGRCVGGRCARRGFIACGTGPLDCNAWAIGGTSGAGCIDTFFRGQPVRTCGGAGVMPCVSNANCPPAFQGNPAWHCNATTGFCER